MKCFVKHGCHPLIQSDGLTLLVETEGLKEKWELTVCILKPKIKKNKMIKEQTPLYLTEHAGMSNYP